MREPWVENPRKGAALERRSASDNNNHFLNLNKDDHSDDRFALKPFRSLEVLLYTSILSLNGLLFPHVSVLLLGSPDLLLACWFEKDCGEVEGVG